MIAAVQLAIVAGVCNVSQFFGATSRKEAAVIRVRGSFVPLSPAVLPLQILAKSVMTIGHAQPCCTYVSYYSVHVYSILLKLSAQRRLGAQKDPTDDAVQSSMSIYNMDDYLTGDRTPKDHYPAKRTERAVTDTNARSRAYFYRKLLQPLPSSSHLQSFSSLCTFSNF